MVDGGWRIKRLFQEAGCDTGRRREVTGEWVDARLLSGGIGRWPAARLSITSNQWLASGVDGGAKWRGAWWECGVEASPGRGSCCRLSSACCGGCGRNERNAVIITKAGGEGYVVEEKQR
jgi:hypothetical protein